MIHMPNLKMVLKFTLTWCYLLEDEPTAKKKAKEFVEKISENTSSTRLQSIQFCHTETAKLEVEEKVAKDGYCIVPIENCPDPY